MATNTTNYGFKKPDESDFYDVNDQNNNWDLADDALKELDTPTFEDYTGDTEVPAAATALEKIKSKGKLATLLSNIKAFCKGCCTLAMIVDNCTTDRSDLPGSAKQLKVLMDLYNVLNTNLNSKVDDINFSSLTNLLNYIENKKEGRFICYLTESLMTEFFGIKSSGRFLITPVTSPSSSTGYVYDFFGAAAYSVVLISRYNPGTKVHSIRKCMMDSVTDITIS